MLKRAEDLRRLLGLLDAAIHESLEVYLIGGANLIAQNLIHRETLDIDVIVPPEFPPTVQKAVKEIAANEKIPNKWINTMPSSDARFLTPAWKERCSLFYEGHWLRVLLLSRKDMLGLKIAAAFDRKKRDAEDILEMDPTEEEWAFGHEWARNYDGNPDWPKWIDELVKELKAKQRG